jgi:lysophospholipid acyltransferase (LPLAT)-like uncharacterized protein
MRAGGFRAVARGALSPQNSRLARKPMPEPPVSPTPTNAPTPPGATPPQTRSGRRLSFVRGTLYRLVVPLAMGLVRFWWLTCRVVRVDGAEHVQAALADGPAIPVYWHQHQLFCVRYLLQLRRPGVKLAFAMSPSVDGEIPAMLARWVGVRPMRGSSTYEGARALRDYFVSVREGFTLAITTDGPKGPRYVFKPGAILLAQMSGRPMLPMAFHASRAWQFHKWDRFVLPRPFARVALALGAPRYVPKGLDAAGLESWQREMERELLAVYRRARDSLGGT